MSKDNVGKLAWKSLFLFLFIYSIVFKGVPTKLNTRNIAFLVWGFVFLGKYIGCNKKLVFSNRFLRYYVVEMAICILSFFHVIIRADINGLLHSDYVAYPFVPYFLIHGLLAPILISSSFENLEEFLKALILASLYQAAFVIMEYSIWPLKIWAQENIATGANIQFIDIDRATGLGASGAALSVWLFWGVYACIYFILTEKRCLRYWGAILIIFTAQFLSARTGLYLGIISIMATEIIKNRNIKVLKETVAKAGVLLLIIIIMVFGLFMGMIGLGAKQEGLVYLFDRNFNSSRIFGANSFFSAFLKPKIPSLDIDMLLGYGVRGGNKATGELLMHHDSGFLMRYLSDGLFMAVMEYVTFAIMLIAMWRSIKSKKLKGYTVGLIAVTFLIEIKEPFMYYYAGVAVVLCIFMLSLKYNPDLETSIHFRKQNQHAPLADVSY